MSGSSCKLPLYLGHLPPLSQQDKRSDLCTHCVLLYIPTSLNCSSPPPASSSPSYYVCGEGTVSRKPHFLLWVEKPWMKGAHIAVLTGFSVSVSAPWCPGDTCPILTLSP